MGYVGRDYGLSSALLQVFYGCADSFVAQPYPVDKGLVLNEREDSWFWIPFFGQRRDGADVKEGKTEPGEFVAEFRIRVKTGSQSYRVVELESEDSRLQSLGLVAEYELDQFSRKGETTDSLQYQKCLSVGDFR